MIAIVTFYGRYYHSNYDLTFIKAIKSVSSHQNPIEDIFQQTKEIFSDCGIKFDKKIDSGVILSYPKSKLT